MTRRGLWLWSGLIRPPTDARFQSNHVADHVKPIGALHTKTKELLALGIAVAIRCDGCVAFHAEAALKQGASRDEVMETMGMAIYMGAGPSVMYAAQAVEAFDQFAAKTKDAAAA